MDPSSLPFLHPDQPGLLLCAHVFIFANILHHKNQTQPKRLSSAFRTSVAPRSVFSERARQRKYLWWTRGLMRITPVTVRPKGIWWLIDQTVTARDKTAYYILTSVPFQQLSCDTFPPGVTAVRCLLLSPAAMGTAVAGAVWAWRGRRVRSACPSLPLTGWSRRPFINIPAGPGGSPRMGQRDKLSHLLSTKSKQGSVWQIL